MNDNRKKKVIEHLKTHKDQMSNPNQLKGNAITYESLEFGLNESNNKVNDIPEFKLKLVLKFNENIFKKIEIKVTQQFGISNPTRDDISNINETFNQQLKIDCLIKDNKIKTINYKKN